MNRVVQSGKGDLTEASVVGKMVLDFVLLSVKSIFLGSVFGLSSALLLKKVNLNYDPIKEFTILVMFAYGSYLTAEQCALSGIISMFSCGLCMSHYSYWNISKSAQKGTQLAVNALSNIS